jgi:uncharacterized RDD family membrane protein YckC
MISTFILIILSVCLWLVMGAVILSFVDDDSHSLFNWYCESPSVLAQAGVLFCWPIVVYLFRYKKEN